jgi:hypothetical protein
MPAQYQDVLLLILLPLVGCLAGYLMALRRPVAGTRGDPSRRSRGCRSAPYPRHCIRSRLQSRQGRGG